MTWQIAEKKSSYAEHASAWELYCCCKLPQLGQFYSILRKRESSVSFFKPKLSLPLVAEKEKSDQVSLFFAFFLLFVPPNQAKMELRFFCDSSNTPDMTFNFRNEKEMSATVFLVFVKGGMELYKWDGGDFWPKPSSSFENSYLFFISPSFLALSTTLLRYTHISIRLHFWVLSNPTLSSFSNFESRWRISTVIWLDFFGGSSAS